MLRNKQLGMARPRVCCHEGSESNVVSSKIPDDPSGALKYFLQRVKEKSLLYALAEADAVSGLSSAKTGKYPVNPARLGIA